MATQKRDPSREPFASPYSDEERRNLDIPAASDDWERATRKSEAARQQIAGGRKLFVDPDLSEHSATASVMTLRSIVETLAQWGKKFNHPRARGTLDDLGRVMMTIMRGDPRIGYRAMLARLSQLPRDHPVVEKVDGETISFISKGKPKTVGKRGLQDRMTRIRRILASPTEE